jgi:cation diffusion facilitator family transporter
LRQGAARSSPDSTSSLTTIYAALVGNLLVAVTKFIAAFWTGSSSMFSEGVHSVVDTLNEVLLLYGYARSKRMPDIIHPLGYGRELYFWSFIVALLVFAVGAGVSLYQGFTHVLQPASIVDPEVNYVVLALSFVFEGMSWFVAYRTFRAAKGELSYWQAVRRSKDPPSFMVLFEDTAALVGILIAGIGIYAADALDMPVLDGVASMLIGVVLATVATIIARESKGLLIGERANPRIAAALRSLAADEPDVVSADVILTVHLAPTQIVAALSIEYGDQIRTPQIEASIERLERRIREEHPQVTMLLVKPQTREQYEIECRVRFEPTLGEPT